MWAVVTSCTPFNDAFVNACDLEWKVKTNFSLCCAVFNKFYFIDLGKLLAGMHPNLSAFPSNTPKICRTF